MGAEHILWDRGHELPGLDASDGVERCGVYPDIHE